VGVDSFKNNKKVQGKKNYNDAAVKETLAVDDGVNIKKHEFMLVFPFVLGIAIETATHHLNLCHSYSDYTDEAYEQLTSCKEESVLEEIR
jgi:hypothetical protein